MANLKHEDIDKLKITDILRLLLACEDLTVREHKSLPPDLGKIDNAHTNELIAQMNAGQIKKYIAMVHRYLVLPPSKTELAKQIAGCTCGADHARIMT